MTSKETDWEQRLQALLRPVEIDPQNQPLALQVEDGLLVPLRLDSKNAWSTRRARWRDLTSRWVSVTAGLNTGQLTALRSLFDQASNQGLIQVDSLDSTGLQCLQDCYHKGVEIFSDPARDFVYVPDDLDATMFLDIAETGAGLEISGKPLVKPNPKQPPTQLSGFRFAPAISGTFHEALADIQANPIIVSAPEIDHFWAQWEQWTETLDLVALLTPETRRLAQSHHFGPATLHGFLAVNPVEPRQLEFTWTLQRKSPAGKIISLPVDTHNPSKTVSQLMARLGAQLAWREESTRNFFNHVFPVWELNRLRDLADDINDTDCVRVVFSPQLEHTKIFSEIPEMTLNLSSFESGDYRLDLEWCLGSERVQSADFLAALGRADRWWQSPDGNWVDLYSPQMRDLQAILQEFEELGLQDFQRGSGWIVDISQLGLVQALTKFAKTRQLSPRWQENATALLHPQPVAVPSLPEGQWRNYQQDGFQWLYARAAAGLGGILADDMGLGKTLQMLAVVAAWRRDHPVPTVPDAVTNAGAEAVPDTAGGTVVDTVSDTVLDTVSDTANSTGATRPTFVVVPASLLATWEEQARHWFPQLRLLVQSVSVGKHPADWQCLRQKLDSVDLVLTTYTLARLDMDFWAECQFSGLILDEAQAVKNPATSTHRALTRLRARWAFALSGTPLENRERDLWSIFALTVPRLLPPLAAFERHLHHAALTERSAARHALSARVSPFLLRRTKESVASEIPAKTEQVIHLDLESHQAELYQKYLVAARLEAEGLRAKRLNVLTALTRLRQLSLSARLINPAVPEDGAKIDYLVDALPDLAAQDHNILVFSQFTSFLALLRARLEDQGITYAYLDGSTRNRRDQVDCFQRGSARVFLISLKSGGFGLNLTAADYVFLCDPWWNPQVESQAIDRAHRIGQTRPVNVYRLVAKNTIEQRVLAMQAQKRELFDQVLRGSENREVTPQITLEQLRALLD